MFGLGGNKMSLGNFFKTTANRIGSLFTSATGQQESAENQYQNQRLLNEQSNELSKELTKYINENKHQWEMSDLEAAGINPLLTTQQSGTNTATTASGSASAGTPAGDPATSMAKLWNGYIQAKTLENQTLENSARIAKMNTESENIASDTILKRLESGYYPKSIESQIRKNLAEADSAKSASMLNSAKTITEKEMPRYWNEASWNLIHSGQEMDARRDLNKKKTEWESARAVSDIANNFGNAANNVIETTLRGGGIKGIIKGFKGK